MGSGGPVQSKEASFENRWGIYEATIWHRSALEQNKLNPMIVFAHGYGARKEMYGWIGEELAAEGYVALFFTVPRRLDPEVMQWVDGVSSAITYLEAESSLRTVVDPQRVGVMGHSMGGLAVLTASTLDDRIRVVVAFAPAVGRVLNLFVLQQPNLSDLHVPVQLQIGSEDELVPVDNVRRAYEEIASQDKSLVVIQGGTHVQFADEAPPLDLSRRAAISLDEFHRRCREAFLPYLSHVLTPNASSTARTTTKVETVTVTQTSHTAETLPDSLRLSLLLILLIPVIGAAAWTLSRRRGKTEPSTLPGATRGSPLQASPAVQHGSGPASPLTIDR